jgi:mono/diheme cytochrome c family protein
MNLVRIASISALATVAIAGGALSQGSTVGRYEYMTSCASCHGPAGKGDGPVARTLKRMPADLTKLSEANKGVFPFARAVDIIDGRFEVETHGPREMPVWGEVYRLTRDPGQSGIPPLVSKETSEAIVRVRILALVEYISTLQGR